MKARICVSLILVASLSVFAPTHVDPSQSCGCGQVTGRVLDMHVEGGVSVAQMVGGIEGTYEYTHEVFIGAGVPELPGLGYTRGSAVLLTNEGNLVFVDAGVGDYAEQACSNVASLLTITGGTGIWEGASGHLILSGYWHSSTETGEFDYQGEVCTSAISVQKETWGRVKAKFRS